MRDLKVVLIKSMNVRHRMELMRHMEELRTPSLTFHKPTSVKEAYHEKTSMWWPDDDDYSVDNSCEFKPFQEVEPQYEEHESFEVVLVQIFS